ncbi:MAG: stalk domain-containing protein [Caldiserica bacterium]|nr:stalk domain-containing protein [Caldisericota bacterium]
MKNIILGALFCLLLLSIGTMVSASTERTIELTIDSNTMLVDGSAVTMDVAPFIKDGRTFVPLRFVSEQLGATVTWTSRPDGTTDKVIVKMLVSEPPSPTSSSPAPTPENIVGKVTSEGAALTVVKVTKLSKIGIWVPEKASDVFLNAEVILENISREKIQGNSLYFSLKDKNGVSYGHSIAALDPRFPLGDIGPGQSAQGNVAFIVPETASGFVLSFQDYLMDNPLTIELGL